MLTEKGHCTNCLQIRLQMLSDGTFGHIQNKNMTTTIIVLVAILILGVGHIVYDIICIKRQELKVEEFIQILQKFIAKHKANKDNSNEVAIIMAHGEDVSNIMEEDEYNSPIVAIQCHYFYNRG